MCCKRGYHAPMLVGRSYALFMCLVCADHVPRTCTFTHLHRDSPSKGLQCAVRQLCTSYAPCAAVMHLLSA